MLSMGRSLGGLEELLLPSPPRFNSLWLTCCALKWVYKILLLLSTQYSKNIRCPYVLSHISRGFSVDVASTDIRCHEPHEKKISRSFVFIWSNLFKNGKENKESCSKIIVVKEHLHTISLEIVKQTQGKSHASVKVHMHEWSNWEFIFHNVLK
jgi:hypothetical protein